MRVKVWVRVQGSGDTAHQPPTQPPPRGSEEELASGIITFHTDRGVLWSQCAVTHPLDHAFTICLLSIFSDLGSNQESRDTGMSKQSGVRETDDEGTQINKQHGCRE